jgi:plasmid stability protein
MADKDERVYASVDEEFKRKLRIEAAKRDMSMSQLVRQILEEEFDDSGNPRTAAATVPN